MENDKGIVYVFSNPAMPGLVKIGMTSKDQIDDRLRELYTTSVPVPFECEYACKVSDCGKVEKALHIAFSPNRINVQREFFKIEPEQAIALLTLLSQEDVTPSVKKEYTETLDADSKEGIKKLKKSRPPLNYEEMGIPVGSTLQFTEASAVVTVAGPRKVFHNNEEQSLTKVTQELLQLDYAVQPTRYWTYNGRNLQEIYEETYPLSSND